MAAHPNYRPCIYRDEDPQTHTNTTQLGTFGRAKRKVEEMTNVIAESRRAGH